MITEDGVNRTLDAAVANGDYDYFATHSDYPGADGSLNEHSGGTPTYARPGASWASAASRSITQSGTESVNIPDGEDFAWLSVWDAGSSGNCSWICPRNGQAKSYYVDPATDVFTSPGHGFSDEQTVVFYVTAPDGLTAGTVYYVRDSTTNTFKVEASIAGGAIDITDWPADANALVSRIEIDFDSGQRVGTIQNVIIDIARAGIPA